MKDVEGRELEVGDIVYRPKFSSLEKCQIVRMTKNAIGISVRKETNTYNGSDYKYVKKYAKFEDHNDFLYVKQISYNGVVYPQLILVAKQQPFSEELKKFVILR